MVAAFEPYDYVVAPSGSCAGMLRTHYPELFEGDPPGRRAPRRSPPRPIELVSFLVDVLNVENVAAAFAAP